MPYYIDGDVKLSQTLAILKYLGRKHGLAPKNETEQMRVDLIEAEAMDIRSKWSATCYNANFVSYLLFVCCHGNTFIWLIQENLRQDFLKNFTAKCKELSNFLSTHKFFAGETVIYLSLIRL